MNAGSSASTSKSSRYMISVASTDPPSGAPKIDPIPGTDPARDRDPRVRRAQIEQPRQKRAEPRADLPRRSLSTPGPARPDRQRRRDDLDSHRPQPDPPGVVMHRRDRRIRTVPRRVRSEPPHQQRPPPTRQNRRQAGSPTASRTRLTRPVPPPRQASAPCSRRSPAETDRTRRAAPRRTPPRQAPRSPRSLRRAPTTSGYSSPKRASGQREPAAPGTVVATRPPACGARSSPTGPSRSSSPARVPRPRLPRADQARSRARPAPRPESR